MNGGNGGNGGNGTTGGNGASGGFATGGGAGGKGGNGGRGGNGDTDDYNHPIGGTGGYGANGGTGGSGGFAGGSGGSGAAGAAGTVPTGAGGGAGGAGGTNTGGGGAGLGGAIFSDGGTVTLTNDTFTADSATGGSGGNPGQGLGGAVFAVNGAVTATFTTFSLNTAAQGGTDLYVLGDLTDAGVLGTGTATASLTDDILGQSATTTVADFFANSTGGGSAPVLSGSNNLISSNPASPTGFTGGTLSATDPLLASALASNGGPTQTLAPSSLSRALQAGIAQSGIITDQRGATRGNPPDIGAYQATPAAPVTASTMTAVTSSGSPSTYGTAVTFTATVTSTGTPTGGVNFSIDGGTPQPGTPSTTTGTTATWTYTTSTLNAGAYSVVASYVASGNFTGSDNSASPFTQTVSPLQLTIAAPTIASEVYNGSTTAGAVTVGTLSGFVGSETVTATATAAAYSSANVGSYPGDVVMYTLHDGTNGGLASNYTLANGSATGQITAAGSTTTVTLGSEFVAGAVTYDGLAHGATATWASTGTDGAGASIATVTYVGIHGTGYGPSPTAPTNAGSYEASSSFPGDTNHANSANVADFTISPASLAVTIGNATHVYGNTVNLASALGATVNTGVNGENLAIAYSSTGNTVTANAGNYGITGGVSDGTGLASNYNVTLTPGVLTVTKATLTGDAITQDSLNMAKQGLLTITVSNVGGLVNGDTFTAFLSTAQYYITVGTNKYVFIPTTVTTSGSSITIQYTLRDSALATELAAQLTNNTSAATAVTAGFNMESTNYTFTDDYLSRLFSTVK